MKYLTHSSASRLPFLLAFLVSSCSQQIRPQEIHSEDICDYCRMAISQLNFACEIVTPDGSAYKFDDIGCMVRYTEEREIPKGSILFVRDFYTMEWVQIEKAMFVKSSKIMTPMNFGVVAFARQGNLKKFLSDFGGMQFSNSQLGEMINVQ